MGTTIPRSLLAAALMLGCTRGVPLQTAQTGPAVPFVPLVDWQWPLLPTDDGWLVGGSGYVSGLTPPLGIRPGLGLGALLIPSHPAGRLWGFGGDLPPPKRFTPPHMLWLPPTPSPQPSAGGSPPARAPSAQRTAPVPRPTPVDLTGPMAAAWTKIGPSLLSVPTRLPWPSSPWLPTPWGPVTLTPGPMPSGVPLVDPGFPPADGTPVQTCYGIPWFLLGAGGIDEVMVLDLISRTVNRPPQLQHHPTHIIVDYIGPMALFGPARGIGRLHLFDLLTGSEDPLPEVPPIDADVILGGAQMTQYGETIVFGAVEDGQRRVHLFDRRTRQTLRLERLNHGRDLVNPCIDWFGSCILATTTGPDGDVLLYDTRTGLIDPLPAVNTAANERSADLAVNGHVFLYTTDAPGHREARLYDRRTGAIDTLPDVNRLGPIFTVRCSHDGRLIAPIYERDGHLRIALYDRQTGMIDPLPELNPPGRNVLPAAP